MTIKSKKTDYWNLKKEVYQFFSVLFLIWVPSEILSGGFLNHVKQLRPKYFNITISQLQYKLFLLILNTRLVIFDRLFSSTWICQLSSKLPIGMTLMTSPYLCTLFSSGMFISAFHEKMQLTSYPFLVCQFYINSLGFLTLFLTNTGDISDGFVTDCFFS